MKNREIVCSMDEKSVAIRRPCMSRPCGSGRTTRRKKRFERGKELRRRRARSSLPRSKRFLRDFYLVCPAHAEVEGAQRAVLVRELHAGSGYLSQSSSTLSFGLEQQSYVKQIDIVWPNGSKSQVTLDSGAAPITFVDQP